MSDLESKFGGARTDWLEDVEWFAWPLHVRGGQHTNGSGSGVLALHTPSGIAAVCESERSQFNNRAIVMDRLRAVLALHYADKPEGL